MGSEGLVFFLWDHRKLIIWVTLLGMVASIVVALVIPEKFKSNVIMYPTRSNSVSKALLTDNPSGYDDILLFGEEEQSEQLLQILNSGRTRDRVIDEFDLYEVYEIEPDDPYRYTKVVRGFRTNVKSERTKFGSIQIEVLDESPERAAKMANFMGDLVDEIKNDMQKERAGRGLEIVEEKVVALEAQIKVMNDSMQVLRELGVQDYHSQTERFNEQLGRAVVQGNQKAIKYFEERFEVLAQYGGAYVTLQDQLYNDVKRLSSLRTQYERAEADYEADLPHKFVVDKARVADKKSYPIRWLIVLMSTIGAFLFSIFLIIVQANMKKIKERNGA